MPETVEAVQWTLGGRTRHWTSPAAEVVLRRRRLSSATPRATFTEWWWPPSPTIFRTTPAGYESFEHAVVVEADPGAGAPYVWAHEFSFVRGEGGCVGLQTQGHGSEGGPGRFALFSIRGVPGAPSGIASGCRIPFGWEAGRSYGMRVWTDQDGSWSAAVGEERDDETLVGRIRVPDHWRRLASLSVTWTKYQGGELLRCSDLAPTSALFSTPTANGGSVRPERHESHLGAGTCEGSRIEPVPGGVRHVLGGV